MMCFFEHHVHGREDIWIIGDEFVAKTADQYFKQMCYTLICSQQMMGTHCSDNFEIKLFHAMTYSSHIQDFMAHLCNTLAGALNEERLPKAIVFVLEDDMINYANVNRFGMSLVYGKLLHYLMSEINKLILAQKDLLPPQAK